MSTLLKRCVSVAAEAAKRAGRLQVQRMGRPRTIQTKRHAVDLVTEVDKASERILHEAIRRHFPDHGFQGEERTRTNPDAPYQWIVDPLDGTTNFVHGMPIFAVSMGLVYEGQCVAGMIYDATRQETFAAIRGSGAWLNGRRIHVSRTLTMSGSLLSTGFSNAFREHPRTYLRWFEQFQSRCHAVRRMGSTAISLAYVACGRQDGFYEIDLWPWDIAAGIVLVEEAGGRITDFRGKPLTRLDGGQLIASNSHIHREILATVRVAPAPPPRPPQ